MRDTQPPATLGPDRQEPAASARPPRRMRHAGLLGARRLLAGRAAEPRSAGTSEQCPGRDGCRRARTLGAGGIERAVRDNGAPELSSRGAGCPLARTSRAVAAGAECPRLRHDDPNQPRSTMISRARRPAITRTHPAPIAARANNLRRALPIPKFTVLIRDVSITQPVNSVPNPDDVAVRQLDPR